MTTLNPTADEVPWFDKRWTRRVAIWQNHQKISGTESIIDFPMYIEWTSTMLGNVQPSGSDFLFTAGDGVTKLCHEIREWNIESHQLRAYVKVPHLSPHHDTLIFLYFGNPEASNLEDRDCVWEDYVLIANPKMQTELNLTFIFEISRKIIRDLIGEKWFSKPKVRIRNHPAYKMDELYGRFVAQDGKIRWPEDLELIKNLCPIFAETMDIVVCSGAKTDKFDFRSRVLGDFSSFGDEKSSSRVKSILNDPKLFSSLLTELSISAWCTNKGCQVTPYEQDGFPDFKVIPVGSKTPYFVECKKLMACTGDNRIRKVISHANTQIKATGEDGYGVVIIDASEWIEDQLMLSDEIPSKILQLKDVVCNSVVSDNSSVSCVIIMWNDYVVMGSPSTSRLLSCNFSRRQLMIHHKSPLYCMEIDSIFSEIGSTISFNVNFSSRTQDVLQSRNSICHCGSRSRFKLCCGRIA